MPRRILGTQRTTEAPKGLIGGRLSVPDERSEMPRLAAVVVVEKSLEPEARYALGLENYAGGVTPCTGYRNDTCSGRVKSAGGGIESWAPQNWAREESSRSEIRAHFKGRTAAIERLAVEMRAYGLDVHDIPAASKGEDGRLPLTRSAVLEIRERIWSEYQDFSRRNLSEHDICYRIVDAITERLRPGQKRETVLPARQIFWDGEEVLLALIAGTKPDFDTVSSFFHGLRARGLDEPLLVIYAGALSVIKAIETCFPRPARPRCLAPWMPNLWAKVPEELSPEFKAQALANYQAPPRAIDRASSADVVRDIGQRLPRATVYYADDLETYIIHLYTPINHRRAICTTNFLERLLRVERRRMKTSPNGWREKLVSAIMPSDMARAPRCRRSVRVTSIEGCRMHNIGQELDIKYVEDCLSSQAQNQAERPSTLSSRNPN